MDSQSAISETELPDRPREEKSLLGSRISTGLSIGTAWVAGDILECSAQALKIGSEQIEAEMARIRGAFLDVRTELEESARRISEQFDPKLAEIFHAHQMMLDSFLSSNEFETELRDLAFHRRTGCQERFPQVGRKIRRTRKRGISCAGG